jgi:L-fucose isomerase-like protein
MLSILTNNLIPAACEVDVTGALSMLALELASGSIAALLDWNNNYGDDPNKAVVFHCSNLPADLLENPTMDAHFSESFKKDTAYGTIFGRILSGPFTFARISTDDLIGEIVFYTGEGEFTNDPLETFGGFGVVEVPNLQDLIKQICLSGFEHHVAATRGNIAHIIAEALENYLDFLKK